MKDLMVRPLCSALEISKRENGESEAGLGVRAEEADQDEVRGQTDGEEHAGEEEKQELQPATCTYPPLSLSFSVNFRIFEQILNYTN